MSDTILNAIQIVKTRLQAILVTGGYNTNAGSNIYLGRKNFTDVDDFPLLSIFTGTEDVAPAQFGAYDCGREITIMGHVQDADEPTVSIEQLIADIQKAMEQTDITMGGIVSDVQYVGIIEPDEPDMGSEFSALGVVYRIDYEREYGS